MRFILRPTILFIVLIWGTLLHAQQKKVNQDNKTFRAEDNLGNRISDPVELQKIFKKRLAELKSARQKGIQLKTTFQNPVPLCENGNFETFDNGHHLIDYTCFSDSPENPVQCVPSNNPQTNLVFEYNPANLNLDATTVPANYQDEYIGNIQAYDQYALKINYKHQDGIGLATVQTLRIKTDNEKWVKFNYKAVLQSIDGNGHNNEQPFFKARVLNQSGTVVNEFCLVGDPSNCIFTQAPKLEVGSLVLFTNNWQAGYLDISSIPNNEPFTIEFMASRCGLGGHFGYAYIDDICNLHAAENLQGSIELDPLYLNCPTLPVSICGSFTIPGSGGILAAIDKL